MAVACGGDEFSAAGPGTGGSSNGTGAMSAAGSGGSSAGAGTGGSGTSGAAGTSPGGSTATAGSGGAGASGSAGGGGASAGASGGGASGSAGASGGGAGGSTSVTPSCDSTTPLCVLDWAGLFGWDGNSADGIGAEARFGTLAHITGDATSLYVSDANAIRRIDIATATVTTLAGALNQPGNLDLAGSSARFGDLAGIATDGVHIWVADTTNLSIRVVNIADGSVDTLASTSSAARGLTQQDLGDNVYYVTPETSSVYRVDKSTGATTQLVGLGGAGFLDGPAATAQLNQPRTVFAMGDGIFIGDTENHRVRAFDGLGVTTFAGTIGGYLDAPRLTSQFRRLRGLHGDFAGNAMYVADSDNFVIRKIDLNTQNVTTVAGANVAGHLDGVGTAAQFNKPMDVYFHAGTKDLFILEDSVIRRMYFP